MRNHFWAYPKGCREFKATLDSGDDDSLSRAFVHGSRVVSRAAERKLRKLAKSQPIIHYETKGEK